MSAPLRQNVRLSDLAGRKATEFEILPDSAQRAALAEELGILGIKKLRFKGAIAPKGNRDWQLTAELGATVVQECVVTLEPVTTRLDEKILRNYVAEFSAAQTGEVEMDEDDTIEPLPQSLDIAAVMIEALDLALPPYPRADGVEAVELAVTPPGAAPIIEEEVRRPFAALAGLKAQLSNDGDDTEN